MSNFDNCSFERAGVENSALKNESQDFGYSLGVLHHIPDTSKAIQDCVKLLKSGAPILLYLYYNFENKPSWFKALWKVADVLRYFISAMPSPLKYCLCSLIAIFIYPTIQKI